MNVGSVTETFIGCWKGHLHQHQTVALLFWVISFGCGLRLVINLATRYWGGAMFLGPLTVFYAWGGSYVAKRQAVPVRFAESSCVSTMAVIMLHDIFTGGQLDIWWLLLLVIDALFLCGARAAVRNGVVLASLAYIIIAVLEETFGFGLYTWSDSELYYRAGHGEPKHGAWGVSVGIVRVSVFFGNAFIVYGIAAGQQRISKLVNLISSDLATFDLDAADRLIAQYEGQRQDIEPLARLAQNLRRYKPYLPPEVVLSDPKEEKFCTQRLAAIKLRFPALPCSVQYPALNQVFHHARIRGGWVHSFDSCSALILFGAQRKLRTYLEGIWGAGSLFLEVQRTDVQPCAAVTPPPSRATYRARVLGSRQFDGASFSPVYRVPPPRRDRLTGKVVESGPRPPAAMPDAKFWCQMGGAVVWFGRKRKTGVQEEDVQEVFDEPETPTEMPVEGFGDETKVPMMGTPPRSPRRAASPQPMVAPQRHFPSLVAPSDTEALAKGRASPRQAAETAASNFDATLDVYIQLTREVNANGEGSRERETPCVAGECGHRTLSKLYGVTNLAAEAALAIRDFCVNESGVQPGTALVLDEWELGVMGNAERKTIMVQGPGLERVEDLFSMMEDLLPGGTPTTAASSNDDAGAPEAAGRLICNSMAAGYLQESHGVEQLHPGADPIFSFGDRDRTSKLERDEMRLQNELPADRLIDITDLTPRETWTKIGEGKTGTVYAARYVRIHKDVAVKELHADASPEERVMFLKELLAMNKVRLDSICNFFGFSKGPRGAVYIVMEYCEQGPLNGVIYDSKLTDGERATILKDVGSSISQALAYIHQKKLVHMDVAARNVLVTASGRYRLADLGFLTQVGERSKVICYPWAPPEAVRSFPDVDAAFTYDIWSFGMLAYEILAGAPPYGRGVSLKVIKGHLKAGRLPNAPPCVQRDVHCERLWREVVLPCLAHQPLARPGMSQMASLFDRNFSNGKTSTFAFLPQAPSLPHSNSLPSWQSSDSMQNLYSSGYIYGTAVIEDEAKDSATDATALSAGFPVNPAAAPTP